MNEPTDSELIAKYGWCPICRAPRNKHLIDTTHEGKTIMRSTLICTAHPYDHYVDKQILNKPELEALRSVRPRG